MIRLPRFPDGPPGVRTWPTVSVRLDQEVWEQTRIAYVTTCHFPARDSVTRWIAIAARKHVDRTPEQRASALARLPRLEPCGVTVPKTWRMDPDLIATIANAITSESTNGRARQSRSQWLTDAIRLEIASSRRVYGESTIAPDLKLWKTSVAHTLGTYTVPNEELMRWCKV